MERVYIRNLWRSKILGNIIGWGSKTDLLLMQWNSNIIVSRVERKKVKDNRKKESAEGENAALINRLKHVIREKDE